MQRILKEPFLHFLLIGVGLFLVYGQTNNADTGDPEQRIVVSTGRIEQLANIFSKTWQRPPTKEELQGLIDDFVLEEVYYRQAVEMGIDRDDTIIRRRLRQKLEFLTADLVESIEPSAEELQAYLDENAERYRRDAVMSLTQVYVSEEPGAEAARARSLSVLETLRTKMPRWAAFEHEPMVARNLEYAAEGETLCDGDEIALFPPVSGG